MSSLRNFLLLIFLFFSFSSIAQPPQGVKWSKDGNTFYQIEDNQIEQIDLSASALKVIVTKDQLTPAAASTPLQIRDFFFSNDGSKVLIYTNSKRCGVMIPAVIIGVLISKIISCNSWEKECLHLL